MLIADEIARREHKKFNLRIRRAGFRSSKTIEQFDFDSSPSTKPSSPTEKVAVLIAGAAPESPTSCHAAVRADYDVLFTQLLATLTAAELLRKRCHGRDAIRGCTLRFATGHAGLIHPSFNYQMTPKIPLKSRCSISISENLSINGQTRSSDQLGIWSYLN